MDCGFPFHLKGEAEKESVLSRFWESATDRNIQHDNMTVFTLPQTSD